MHLVRILVIDLRQRNSLSMMYSGKDKMQCCVFKLFPTHIVWKKITFFTSGTQNIQGVNNPI